MTDEKYGSKELTRLLKKIPVGVQAEAWATLNAGIGRKIPSLQKLYDAGYSNGTIFWAIFETLGLKECLRAWNKQQNPELDFEKFWEGLRDS